jgi:hypothetical protein
MPKQFNNAGDGNIAGKAWVWALFFLALAGAALFAVYTYYGNGAPPAEIAENIISKFTDTSPTEIAGNIISRFTRKEETAAVKKPDNPDGGGVGSESGGKSVADILGGPAFADAKSAIQAAVLRGGAPEPPVKTLLPESSKPKADSVRSAPALPPRLSQPAPRRLPPFPASNGVPTLSFSANPKSAAPSPVPSVAVPSTPPPSPPPPLPPPKPRAAMLLPGISGHLSDRADMKVNMAVELSYESNNALREELEFKRDMLTTVAASVIHKHEYGRVSAETLKSDILSTFNEHLQAGKLNAVDIKNFQIGQEAEVAAGK